MQAVRSAIFIDFDNLYITLKSAYGQRAATQFHVGISDWIAWLCKEPLWINEESYARRMLLRRCYLNPNVFGQFRSDLTSAGFEVVDCPPMTSRGKTSADIHMVLDMMDALNHPTEFDEFVIVSADTDFAPVLRRLRACDRRTVVVAAGNVSAGYRAAADFVVDEAQLVEALMSLGSRPALGGTLAGPVRPGSDDGASAQAAPMPPEQIAAFNEKAHALLWSEMSRSPSMIEGAALAALVRESLGEDLVRKTQWGGAGAFGEFVARIDGLEMYVSAQGTPYVRDPERHPLPVDGLVERDPLDDLDADVAEFVRRACNASGAPRLSREEHALVFHSIIEEVAEHGFNLTRTSKGVRDKCARTDGRPLAQPQPRIARSDVNFVLKGLFYSGVRLDDGEAHTAEDLGRSYLRNVVTLCRNEGLGVSLDEENLLEEWILGGLRQELP